LGDIELKAAWHWGINNSVINDHLGEPGCTPLYVGLPSTWGSVEVECFLVLYGRAPQLGTFERYECMNDYSDGSGSGAFLFVGCLQEEPRVDFKSLNLFVGWEVTP